MEVASRVVGYLQAREDCGRTSEVWVRACREGEIRKSLEKVKLTGLAI